MPKHYLSVLDFDAAGFAHLLELAARLKSERKLGRRAPTAQALLTHAAVALATQIAGSPQRCLRGGRIVGPRVLQNAKSPHRWRAWVAAQGSPRAQE